MNDLTGLCRNLHETLNREHETQPLAESLAQVHFALKRHWSVNYMPWFTDHGVEHSERVANNALKLAETLQYENLNLKPLEQYLLCSAALLHDIGMNDVQVSSDRQLGDLLPEDYIEIRNRHAIRSAELITSDPTAWGLPPDDILILVVSLIARAHGTPHYRSAIPDLTMWESVQNCTVRGPLLAAILLIADELDLHYSRAGDLQSVNTISEAHEFKHQCIVKSSLGVNSVGEVEIHITLRFPQSLDGEDRKAIEKWIVAKLRRQIGLVEREIVQGLSGHGRISRAIKIARIDYPLGSFRPPSPGALAVVRAEAAVDSLIDHAEALDTAEQAILSGSQLIVLAGRWEATALDLDGQEDLLETLEKRAHAAGKLVTPSRRLRLNGAGEASEVLDEWMRGVTKSNGYISPDETIAEWDRRSIIHDLLANRLQEITCDTSVICTLSFLDGMESAAKEWLLENSIPALCRVSRRVHFVATSSTPAEDSVLPQISIPVFSLDIEEVKHHLTQLWAEDTAETMSQSGLSYKALKKVVITRETQLLGG